MKNPYYPDEKLAQAGWWENIVSNGASQLAIVGFAAPEISPILLDANWGVYLLRTLPNTYADLVKSVTGYADSYLDGPAGGPPPAAPPIPAWPTPPVSVVLTGIEERRIAWVQRAKKSPAYDPETIGAVLRLEPTGDPFDPATYQAEISAFASQTPSTVTFKFRKASGNVDGINLYLRRKGETVWTFVRFYSKSPATDTTPVKVAGTPEERDYQARAVIADTEVGLFSEIESVLVRA